MFRRAERPEGSPLSLDQQVARALPAKGPEGTAHVYTMPEKGASRYVGTYDTWLYRDQLREWQDMGMLIWS
jgi:hypothetical protein